ncbi:MAG: hypothetical protein WBW41_20530 [Verrucomicrobiia bacterium]
MNTPLNDLIELHELAQRHENENCAISLHRKIAGSTAAPRMPAVITEPTKSMSILNKSVHAVDAKTRRI